MPKRPQFDYKKTPRGWLINVPASISKSGNRERLYFTTRDLAKAESQRLSEKYKKHGENASVIAPGLADDATKAMEMLSAFAGVSLCEAARFYKTHHDIRSKAPTLRKAWDIAIESHKHHRPTTRRDYRLWKNALPDGLLDTNVVDITPEMIKKSLDGVTNGKTRWMNGLRYLSTVLQQCVKNKQLAENPCKRVETPRAPETDDEVTVYTIDQMKALFAACKDYADGMDRKCSACAVPFAFLAFAGLRPNELERLVWEDIDLSLGVIRLGSSKTKKARRRNVRIQTTLQAWLETIPATQRKGKIVPSRWRYRSARVRKEAGIDGLKMADALRHSFGTYLLATENKIDSLRSDMGHEHIRVFLNHYHKAITADEAAPYWRIHPRRKSATPTKVAKKKPAKRRKTRPVRVVSDAQTAIAHDEQAACGTGEPPSD
jgi:integrase